MAPADNGCHRKLLNTMTNRFKPTHRGPLQTVWRRWLFVVAGVAFFGPTLSGCSEIIPRFELRDDYMGKRFLQPNRVVGEVERDELGNPILPKKRGQESDQ